MIDRIRKQVYTLTEKDIQKNAVWKFCADREHTSENDEATVKPLLHGDVLHYVEEAYIVRAKFISADGDEFFGYITLTDKDDMGVIQPTVITKRGQVNFWLGSVPITKEELDGYYHYLGKTQDQLFPMYFESDNDSVIHPKIMQTKGRIEGFYCLNKGLFFEKIKVAR